MWASREVWALEQVYHFLFGRNCHRVLLHHSVNISNLDEVARIAFNAPLRNLVRAFAMMDTDESRKAARSEQSAVREQVHMCVTGSDYSGMYAEQLLWRQLLLLSNPMYLDATAITPPVIAYAPLIQDWAGSKLSKSLYVVHGEYKYCGGDVVLGVICEMKKQEDLVWQGGEVR